VSVLRRKIPTISRLVARTVPSRKNTENVLIWIRIDLDLRSARTRRSIFLLRDNLYMEFDRIFYDPARPRSYDCEGISKTRETPSVFGSSTRGRRSQGVKARPDGTVDRSTRARARARSTSFLLSFFRRNGSKKAE